MGTTVGKRFEMSNEEYDDLDALLEDNNLEDTQKGSTRGENTKQSTSKDEISPNFQKVMNDTVHRLNNKAESADTGPLDKERNELLDKLFANLNIDENGETGADDEDAMDILLKNILSKEMLYETIKKNRIETKEKIRKFDEITEKNDQDTKEYEINKSSLQSLNSLIEIYESETYDLDKDYYRIRDIMDELEENGYGDKEVNMKETDDEMLNSMQKEFDKLMDQNGNCEQQ